MCVSCSHSHVYENDLGEEYIICRIDDRRVPMRRSIVRCDSYTEFAGMDEWKAERIGWVLQIDKGRVIGFKRPKRDKWDGGE